MRNAELDEAQAGIKISGRNINNLRYGDDTTPMAEPTGCPHGCPPKALHQLSLDLGPDSAMSTILMSRMAELESQNLSPLKLRWFPQDQQ